VTDVLTFGEAMLLLHGTEPGPLQLNAQLAVSAAGAEATVATGLARLGHQVCWAGRVGADDAGDLVSAALRSTGADARLIQDLTAPTGLMLRQPRLPGRYRVSYYRSGSAGSQLTTEDLTPLLSPMPRIVHATGITTALSDTAARATRYAFTTAHQAGATVSYDVNLRLRLTNVADAARMLADLLPLINLLILGEDELPVLAAALGRTALDTNDAVATSAVPDLGALDVIVKQGERGATARISGHQYQVPAPPIVAVDTVGAGDAFCAGYLSGVLDNLAPQDRLLRAVTVAAFCVQTSGDWQGLPTRADLPLIAASSGHTDR